MPRPSARSTPSGAISRAWYSKTIRNTANIGWFSADRTIREYARDIWNVPVS